MKNVIKVGDLCDLIENKEANYYKLLSIYNTKNVVKDNQNKIMKDRYKQKLVALKNILGIGLKDLKNETRSKEKIVGKAMHYDRKNIYHLIFFDNFCEDDYISYYEKYYKLKLDTLSYIFEKENKIIYFFCEDTGEIYKHKEKSNKNIELFTKVKDEFFKDLQNFDTFTQNEKELEKLILKQKDLLKEISFIEEERDVFLKSKELMKLNNKIDDLKKQADNLQEKIVKVSSEIKYNIKSKNFNLTKTKRKVVDYELASKIAQKTNNQNLIPYRIKKEIDKNKFKEIINNKINLFKDSIKTKIYTNLRTKEGNSNESKQTFEY